MRQIGVEPVLLVAKDEYGNRVEMEFSDPSIVKQDRSVDELVR